MKWWKMCFLCDVMFGLCTRMLVPTEYDVEIVQHRLLYVQTQSNCSISSTMNLNYINFPFQFNAIVSARLWYQNCQWNHWFFFSFQIHFLYIKYLPCNLILPLIHSVCCGWCNAHAISWYVCIIIESVSRGGKSH